MSNEVTSVSTIVPIPKEENTNNNENAEDQHETPKDSAYGWLVVFVSFAQQFVADGLTYTLCLLYAEMSKEFPSASKGEMAMILSILVGCTQGSGPIASILIKKWGLRIVSVLGSVIAATGYILSYFTPNVTTMYATIGVLGGLGFSLMYVPAMVSVPLYFDKRLALAMGIACSGTGMGTLFCEWAVGLALTHITWRQTLLISGGVIAFTVFNSLPQKLNNAVAKDSSSNSVDDEEGKISSSILDWDLLKNGQFLCFCLADCLLNTGSFIPFVYLPEIERQLTGSTSTTVMGFIGGGTVFARLLLGLISDKAKINCRHICICLSATAGLTTIASIYFHSVIAIRAYAALLGTCIGTFVSLRPVVLVDLFGLDKLTSAFGFLMTMHATGMAFGPLIAAYSYEHFGKTHEVGFYFGGITTSLNAFILFIIPWMRGCQICPGTTSAPKNS